MISTRYIVVACIISTIVGVPVTQYSKPKTLVCGIELLVLIHDICEPVNKITGIRSDDNIVGLLPNLSMMKHHCCQNCSTELIVQFYCLDKSKSIIGQERVVSSSVSPLIPSTVADASSIYINNTPMEYWGPDEWAALNKTLATLFEDGNYQWGVSK